MLRHGERHLALCGHVDDLVIAGKESDVEWCLGQSCEKGLIFVRAVFFCIRTPKNQFGF